MALAFFVLRPSGHHPRHAQRGDDDGDQAQKPQQPVEHEHDRKVGDRRQKRTDEIGQAVRQHPFGQPRGVFYDATQLSGGTRREEPQRHARQMLQQGRAHVLGRAERRHVREHERAEIHCQPADREPHGRQPPRRGLGCAGEIGCHGHQVAQDKPHARQHGDGAQRVDPREYAAEHGVFPRAAREIEQARKGVSLTRLRRGGHGRDGSRRRGRSGHGRGRPGRRRRCGRRRVAAGAQPRLDSRGAVTRGRRFGHRASVPLSCLPARRNKVNHGKYFTVFPEIGALEGRIVRYRRKNKADGAKSRTARPPARVRHGPRLA